MEEKKNAPYKHLTDQPISTEDQDKFGYGPFVEGLKDVISNSESPLNIGLFGPWGAGKSSILNQCHIRIIRSALWLGKS